jgi:TetR/AcrR family transcriptional regulator, cholesterol catabolism regulator
VIERSNEVAMAYDARRETILETAALLFASQGYERTTIRDVARAAGISVAGLYYYVRGKDELLYRICERSFTMVLDSLTEKLAATSEPRGRVRVVIRNHFEHFLRHMNEMKVLTRELDALEGAQAAQIYALRHRYYTICRNVVSEVAVASVPPRLATMALFGMLNWIHMWYRPEADGNADTLADGMTRIFLDGYASSAETRTPWARPTAASR